MPEKMVQCYRCKGTGVESCYKCSGTGRPECPKCKGKGRVWLTQGLVGTTGSAKGGAVGRREEQCKACQATGRLNQQCSACNGTGKSKCATCKGTGKVTQAEADRHQKIVITTSIIIGIVVVVFIISSSDLVKKSPSRRPVAQSIPARKATSTYEETEKKERIAPARETAGRSTERQSITKIVTRDAYVPKKEITGSVVERESENKAAEPINETFANLAICKALVKNPDDKSLLLELKKEIGSFEKGDDRIRLMAVYCLGCIYTGQRKEASSVIGYIRSKHASSPNSKYVKGEYISEVCWSCQGSGESSSACIKCRGQQRCSTCRGSGSRTTESIGGGSRTIKCLSCKGSGRCTSCSGTGKTVKTCSSCGGKGNAISKSKVYATYMSLLQGRDPS